MIQINLQVMDRDIGAAKCMIALGISLLQGNEWTAQMVGNLARPPPVSSDQILDGLDIAAMADSHAHDD